MFSALLEAFATIVAITTVILNRPLSNRAEEEYEYAFDDEPTPSPQAYGGTPNPQTPGYPDPSSPQVNPQYNPQTPGTPAM